MHATFNNCYVVERLRLITNQNNVFSEANIKEDDLYHKSCKETKIIKALQYTTMNNRYIIVFEH